jgi:hypothetical protein
VPIENPDSSKLIDLSTRIFNNNAEYVMKIENYRIKLQHEKNLLIDRIKENYN